MHRSHQGGCEALLMKSNVWLIDFSYIIVNEKAATAPKVLVQYLYHQIMHITFVFPHSEWEYVNTYLCFYVVTN